MTNPSAIDSDPVADGDANARGHAALLLSESLLHGLIARRMLSASDAIDIVDTAIHVQRDRLAELDDQDPTIARSLALLVDMQRSLDTDLLGD